LPREDEFAEFADELSLTGAHSSVRPFTAEQLVACEKCKRSNAPTRMNCLYCGAQLPVDAETSELRRPVLKKLEEWEQGFSVVLLPRGARASFDTDEETHTAAIRELTGASVATSTEEIAEASLLLRLDAARLAEIIGARRALPLARAATIEEAELTRKRLEALSLNVEIFSDETLEKPHVRARALAFNEDALVCFPGLDAEPRSLLWTDIVLLVVGRIITKRVEVTEREAKLSTRSEIVDSREIVSDEAVLDIYASTKDAASFRIMADNFDYSCLGASKSLLARENFVALTKALCARAGGAILDEEFARMRGLLSSVWPPAERKEALGLRRERPGRVSAGAATVFSNETQFTRYARLRSILALRERADAPKDR
jgi:hypothetical protein